MNRPRILDLFCGAGGMAMGLHRAGFEVVGVDKDPQPRYPFEFWQADALEFLGLLAADLAWGYDGRDGFVAIHAGPPCQAKSVMSKSWNGKPDEWPQLIAPVRALLEEIGLPYIIENVEGARGDLRDPVKLCGSMFDLPIERHRYFETNWPLEQPPCNHARQRELWPEGFPPLRSGREGQRARVVGIYGTGGGDAKDLERWKWAMGIEWMHAKHDLAEAIPPAYSEWVGTQLLAHLDQRQEMAA